MQKCRLSAAARLAFVSLLVSCGSPPAPAPPAPSPRGEEAAVASAQPVSSERVEPPRTVDAAVEGRRNHPLLTLPRSPEFVRAPLPQPLGDRYSSFRETLRIDVGQSHLTEIDRLPSGHLVTLSQAEGKVRVYERGTRRLIARHDVPGYREFEPIVLLGFPTSPDRYVVGTPDGLGVYDAASGALLADVDRHAVWKLRWSDDGQVLMALGSEPGAPGSSLRFFARGPGSELVPIGTLPFEGRVDAWALSRDARLLALAHYPWGVQVIDLDTGQQVFAGGTPRYAGDVDLSPDGRLLAVAGDGLLVVDLALPERRAFYSHVKNNMGHVRFSPSSDAVIASSYDGKIRILELQRQPSGQLDLALLGELSHAGEANVYAFSLSKDGRELVSASGDRTLRAFAARPSAERAPVDAERTFHDLETWKRLLPPSIEPARPSEPKIIGGEWALDAELAGPRPSRITPGLYACKITSLYKLRDCYVHRDAAGHTRLEFAADNLLHLGGVLWDDGPSVRFEGKLLSPSMVIDCRGCERQPLHAVFRGQNGHYQGLLTFRTYHDPLVPLPIPPLDVRIEEANDRYPLVLEYRGPLPDRQSRSKARE